MLDVHSILLQSCGVCAAVVHADASYMLVHCVLMHCVLVHCVQIQC